MSLRFAALRRVSTERQKTKGESLQVQTATIEEAVERIGGKIVRWYGGQEHSTAGWAKSSLDALLADAAKNKFDAFIVAHPDRWSRDNTYARKGLEVFRKHSIRFFVADVEHDLSDPNAKLFLGISAEIGEYFAEIQKRKSIQSRVKRAQTNNEPTCGKLPFGRTYDKQTKKWGVDEEKQALVVDAARRYLDGESLKSIANAYAIDRSNLHYILNKQCGDRWEQNFYVNRTREANGKVELGEPIVVETSIPRLLSDKTIKEIHRKAAANKTYSHGHTKNRYMLSRMIFCQQCGHALYGQTSKAGYRYYRHNPTYDKDCSRPQDCNAVAADQIEGMVIGYLWEMFGNAKKVKEAVERATPDLDKRAGQEKRAEEVERSLAKIKAGRGRLIEAVVDGTFDADTVKAQNAKLTERETVLIEERDRLREALANSPSLLDIEAAADEITTTIKHANHSLDTMTDDEKSMLCQMVFAERLIDGRRAGVYVTWKERGKWVFDIQGVLIDYRGMAVLDAKRRKEWFMSGAEQQNELLSQSATH